MGQMIKFSWALVLHMLLLVNPVNAKMVAPGLAKSIANTERSAESHVPESHVKVPTQLKPRQPEWTMRVVEAYSNGLMAKVRFFEDETAVKEITYYENGAASGEADLTEVDGEVVYHGPSVLVDREGKLHAIRYYKEGKLHGPLKMVFASGKVRLEGEYREGLEEGLFVQYYEDGSKMEEARFISGKKDGEVAHFYPTGRKSKSTFYKAGLKEGRETTWYENGVIAKSAHFVNDKLQNEGTNPAVVAYYPQKGIKEVQEFEAGIPVNCHIQYHQNGKEQSRILFKNGAADGAIYIKSAEGKILGERFFKDGVPYGHHFQKHENGELAFEATYDQEGNLLTDICEYSDSGQILSKMRNVNGVYEGDFAQWYPNGNMKVCGFYKEGMLEGERKTFFENGRIQTQGSFIEGKRNGRHIQFNEKGEKIADVGYLLDLPEGNWQIWFDGKVLKQETQYKEGKKDGIHREYYEDGALRLEAGYKRDQFNGECKEYYQDKALAYHAFYKDGLYDGVAKAFYPGGTLRFIHTYDAGKPIGEHKDYFEQVSFNGEPMLQRQTVYDTEGVLHGEQRTYHPNGMMATIHNYDAGMMQGLRAAFNAQGEKIEEAWHENGKLHGPYMVVDGEGRETIVHYVENHKEGPFTIYHPQQEGQPKVIAMEGGFKNSKHHGESREYNVRGKLVAVTTHKEGKKEGLTALYNENGKVLMTIEFVNDQKNGKEISYFGNGLISRKSYYKDNVLDGTYEEFYPTGTLYNRSFYKQGQLDGLSVSYSEEGVKLFEAEYSEGKKSGSLCKFYEDGSLKLEQRFDKDVLVYKKTIDQKGKVTEHAL